MVASAPGLGIQAHIVFHGRIACRLGCHESLEAAPRQDLLRVARLSPIDQQIEIRFAGQRPFDGPNALPVAVSHMLLFERGKDPDGHGQGLPERVGAFFPKELENQLLLKELAYQNKREDQIKETRFQILMKGGGRYEVVVVDQRLF